MLINFTASLCPVTNHTIDKINSYALHKVSNRRSIFLEDALIELSSKEKLDSVFGEDGENDILEYIGPHWYDFGRQLLTDILRGKNDLTSSDVVHTLPISDLLYFRENSIDLLTEPWNEKLYSLIAKSKILTIHFDTDTLPKQNSFVMGYFDYIEQKYKNEKNFKKK